MCGMVHTTELGSKLSVAVKEKKDTNTNMLNILKCPCPILTKSNTLVAMWCYVLSDIWGKQISMNDSYVHWMKSW